MPEYQTQFNQEFYQDVLNSLTVPVLALAQDGTITAVNEAWQQFAAKNCAFDSGTVGANYFDVVKVIADVSAGHAAEIEAGLRAVSGGHLARFEKECACRASGQGYWFLVRAAPFKGRAGEVVVSHTNIGRLKQAELARQESESRFRSLAENSPDIIYILDLNISKAIYFNRTDLLGYRAAELEQPGSVFAAVHPADTARVANHWQMVKQGQAGEIEYRFQAKDGRWEWLQSRETPLNYNNDGSSAQVLVTLTVITERKRVENELRQSQNLFQQVIASISDHIYVTAVDAAGGKTNIYLSPNMKEITGYAAADFVEDWELWPTTLIYPADRGVAAAQAQKLVAGQSSETEYRMVRADHEVIWVRDSARVVTEAGGRRLIYGVISDITERKQFEAKLRESEEKFRLIAENTSDGILVIDEEKITYSSPAYNKFMGIGDGDQINLGPAEIAQFIHPADRDRVLRDIYAAIGQHQAELVYSYRINPDFIPDMWREDHARFIFDEQGHYRKSYVVCRDITARKQAEQNLQQRNRELEFLNRVGQALVSTLGLEQMLAAVLQEIRQLLQVFSSSVWLMEPTANQLVCRYAADPYRERLQGWKLALGQGLVGWSVQHNQSVLTGHSLSDPRHYPQVDQCVGITMRSIISVPLRVKHSVIGALVAVDPAANRFTPTDLSLVESLSATIAIAIENARLFDLEQQQRQAAEEALQETQLLHRISSILAQTSNMQAAVAQVLGEYLAALKLEQGGITLFDPAEQTGILYALYRRGQPHSHSLPIKIASPVYRELIETQQPVFILDAATDPRLANNQELTKLYQIKSILFVPLRVQGQVVGALGADSTDQPRYFTAREISLGQAVAAQLAGAIERIRLDEDHRRLSTVVEQAAETIIITDPSGNIVYANPHFETSSGYSVAEALGQNPNLVQSGRQNTAFYEELWAAIGAGRVWHGRFVNRRKEGSLYHEEASIFPIKNSVGEIINYAAVKRDITERVQAEEQRRLLAAAIESTTEGVIITDNHLDWPRSQIVFTNRGMCQMSGYRQAELLGQTPRVFYGPDSNQTTQTALKSVVSQGQTFRAETVNYRKDGSSYQAMWHISPIFDDETGQATHFIALVQDITEVQMLEAQLRHSQKIEAIGRLAGGVAHDFNNILTVIIGYADFLLIQHPEEDGSLHHDLAAIKRAAERAAGLTRQLLAFSRRQVLHPQQLDLNDLVTNLKKMLRRLLSKNIELKTRLAPRLEPIYADPGQIEQVIVNLVVNARDAMPDGGVITLETDSVHLDTAAGLINSKEFEPGPYLRLTVGDTGEGIDAADLERIFEPFFTTKAVGQGTGLGLSMVHGIVSQSQGYIKVDSQAGQGARFSVYLPQAKSARLPETSEKMAPLPPGRETVLLVEDEAEVRGVATQALEKYGYSVLVAANGEDAYLLARQYQGTIHLLLTNMVLTGSLTGITLAQMLAVERPDVKTVFMSGNTREFDLLPDPISPDTLLQKPFTLVGLIARVQAALAASGSRPKDVNDQPRGNAL